MPQGANNRRFPQPLPAKTEASAGRCNIHAAGALPGRTASCHDLRGQQSAEERPAVSCIHTRLRGSCLLRCAVVTGRTLQRKR